MVRLLNEKTVPFVANLIKSYFRFQEFFTDIVEINRPKIDSCLFAMWHKNQCSIYALDNKENLNVLISKSKDGDVIAEAIKPMGFKVVRGSKGKKGAVEASIQMVDALKRGESCAMMVDGPRGPAEKAKDGAIKIAKMSGKPIVPMCWYSRGINWIKLPSWDGLCIPIFNIKIINMYGEPIFVPEDADEKAIEEARLKLQTSLEDIEKRASEEYNKVFWYGLWRRKQK